jgi:DNA-binding CsgD family transcriptional regulator
VHHFFLFLYFFVILTGVVSVTITSFIYVRTRNKLLSRYVLYVSNLTFFIFVYLFILLYLNLNVPEIDFYVLLLTVILALLSCFLLMYTITTFTHSLVCDEPQKRRDMYAGILAGIACALMAVSFRVNLSEKTLSQERNIWNYLSLVVFCLPVVYSIVLKVVSLRRLDGERRNIVRNIALLDLIFLPGVVFDMYLYVRFQVFVFSPIIYCTFCILFTRYIAKQYFAKLALVSSGLDEAVIDGIMTRAGISPREKEVILLISNGLGNREIADKLFISLNTVKTHNRNIFQKLGVRSRFELLVKLQEVAAEQPVP